MSQCNRFAQGLHQNSFNISFFDIYHICQFILISYVLFSFFAEGWVVKWSDINLKEKIGAGEFGGKIWTH